MAKERGSIFEMDDDALDVSGFAAKGSPDPAAPSRAEVRAVSEAANFPSREAKRPRAEAAPVLERRPARRLKTGRTEQLNVRASVETIKAFYALADQQKWKSAETFERAVAALKRELIEHR